MNLSPSSRDDGRYLLCFLVLPEISLLVSRFEHPPVLHHQAELAGKADFAQQPHGGGGQQLRGAHLAAKLGEAFCLAGRLQSGFHGHIPCEHLALSYTIIPRYSCQKYEVKSDSHIHLVTEVTRKHPGRTGSRR